MTSPSNPSSPGIGSTSGPDPDAMLANYGSRKITMDQLIAGLHGVTWGGSEPASPPTTDPDERWMELADGGPPSNGHDFFTSLGHAKSEGHITTKEWDHLYRAVSPSLVVEAKADSSTDSSGAVS